MIYNIFPMDGGAQGVNLLEPAAQPAWREQHGSESIPHVIPKGHEPEGELVVKIRTYLSKDSSAAAAEIGDDDALLFRKPTSKSISIRIPSTMLAELKDLARGFDIPYQRLVKVFLAREIVTARREQAKAMKASNTTTTNSKPGTKTKTPRKPRAKS